MEYERVILAGGGGQADGGQHANDRV